MTVEKRFSTKRAVSEFMLEIGITTKSVRVHFGESMLLGNMAAWKTENNYYTMVFDFATNEFVAKFFGE